MLLKSINSNQVRLGFEAGKSLEFLRETITHKIHGKKPALADMKTMLKAIESVE